MRARRLTATAIGVAVVVVIVAAIAILPGGPRLLKAHRASGVPRLRHVVEIVFENRERGTVMSSPKAGEFRRLAATGAEATAYDGVAHPSLPNYLALVSGSTHGVTSDCTDCPQRGPTVGSQLSARGLTWGVFAEDYPGGPRFAKRHVPFLYFGSGHDHVHPLGAFEPSRLQAFSFVVPNLCHDMHDCSIAVGNRWLARFVRPILRVPRTAVFVVFDEGTSADGGGGNVPLVVAGTAVRSGSVFTGETSHYGLLRTIESALDLPFLGRARSAAPITGIWQS